MIHYQLCEGKGAELCDSCARCVYNLPDEVAEKYQDDLMTPTDSSASCRWWKPRHD